MADHKPELRFEFVGMMFAVAAGEIGIKFGVMAQFAAPPDTCKFVYAFPAICHLLIAALIVATSWVGWSRSRVSMSIRDVMSVFSWPFAVLLLDVLLVVCYFIIVDTVELISDEEHRTFTVHPSAGGESFWVFVTFCGYLFWDFLTKVIIRPETGNEERYRFWKRGWVSILVTGLGLAAWLLFRNLTNYWAVVYADAALIALLLLFRSLKDLVTAHQMKQRRDVKRAGVISALLLIGAAATGVLACRS